VLSVCEVRCDDGSDGCAAEKVGPCAKALRLEAHAPHVFSHSNLNSAPASKLPFFLVFLGFACSWEGVLVVVGRR
jgi:hypothetical protein